MFGWTEVFGKVLGLKFRLSRVSWNSVDVDIRYRWLRIVTEVVVPT